MPPKTSKYNYIIVYEGDGPGTQAKCSRDTEFMQHIYSILSNVNIQVIRYYGGQLIGRAPLCIIVATAPVINCFFFDNYAMVCVWFKKNNNTLECMWGLKKFNDKKGLTDCISPPHDCPAFDRIAWCVAGRRNDSKNWWLAFDAFVSLSRQGARRFLQLNPISNMHVL